jgi:hypothetical protein
LHNAILQHLENNLAVENTELCNKGKGNWMHSNPSIALINALSTPTSMKTWISEKNTANIPLLQRRELSWNWAGSGFLGLHPESHRKIKAQCSA